MALESFRNIAGVQAQKERGTWLIKAKFRIDAELYCKIRYPNVGLKEERIFNDTKHVYGLIIRTIVLLLSIKQKHQTLQMSQSRHCTAATFPSDLGTACPSKRHNFGTTVHTQTRARSECALVVPLRARANARQ